MKVNGVLMDLLQIAFFPIQDKTVLPYHKTIVFLETKYNGIKMIKISPCKKKCVLECLISGNAPLSRDKFSLPEKLSC